MEGDVRYFERLVKSAKAPRVCLRESDRSNEQPTRNSCVVSSLHRRGARASASVASGRGRRERASRQSASVDRRVKVDPAIVRLQLLWGLSLPVGQVFI